MHTLAYICMHAYIHVNILYVTLYTTSIYMHSYIYTVHHGIYICVFMYIYCITVS